MRHALFDHDRLDLTGRWSVVHRVEQSELQRYIGLEIEFQVMLSQTGRTVVGTGEKFVVDLRLAGRGETSRLELAGQVTETSIELSLVERSPERPERAMNGMIVWSAMNPNFLVGTFKVDAARSSGSSRALRSAEVDALLSRRR